MKNKKKMVFPAVKNMLRLMGVLILFLTLALLLECVFFQRQALLHKEEPILIEGSGENERCEVEISDKEALAKLTDEEQNAILVQRENERLIAEYNGEAYTPKTDDTLVEKDGNFYRKIIRTTIRIRLKDAYYTKKLSVQLPLEEDGGYQAELFSDGKSVKSNLYCSINAKIDTGVMNVNASADELEIVLNTQHKIDAGQLKIRLSNDFTINVMRTAFLFFLLCATAFIVQHVIAAKEAAVAGQKPESIFAVAAFFLGGLLICGIGTNQVGFDEYVHAKAAYDLSFGATIETTEAAMQMKGNLLPFFNNPEERALVEAYEKRVAEEIAPDITHQSRMVRTETRVYYPMAAGFYIGRKLGIGFAGMVALAKLGNLLVYIAVVWLAIRIAKQYKLLLVLIGLLPNNIFIAASITYDAVVTAFLLLATVLVTNEILEPARKIKWTNLFAMLLCFEIGCLSKPVYIVMALMIVFFGKNKFENRLQEAVLKLSVIAMAGLMLYNIFCPTPVAGGDYALVSDFSYAGDPRNTGSSVMGQVSYILGNPLAYTGLLLKSMGTMFLDYTLVRVPFVGYAYLGFAPAWINWFCLCLAVLAAVYTVRETQYFVKEEDRGLVKRSAIGLKYIVLNLIMCFGVTAIIWTSMYVSYTAVGADVIEGVQGRYFIPLFLPFFSCLFLRRSEGKKKWKLAFLWEKLSAPMVYGVLIGLMILLNLAMTYCLVITRLNV